MKKSLLTGIAALLLATGAATAQGTIDDGFPKELQGLWCVSLGESTPTRIILNPYGSCEKDGGVVLISFSQHYGPNPGGKDCHLDTVRQVEPGGKDVVVDGMKGKSSPVYEISLECFPGGRGWTNFTAYHNSFDDGTEELVVMPTPQG